MQIQEFSLSYTYRESDEESLGPFLSELERHVGGRRKPYSHGAGALDLVMALEIGIVLLLNVTLRPWLSKYFEGLLNADAVKKVGEGQRLAIQEWTAGVAADLGKFIKAVATIYASSDVSFQYKGRQKALALELVLPRGIQCYVVLNHEGVGPSLLGTIPDGVVRAIQFAADGRLPTDAKVVQLYFDRESEQWIYLFVPSLDGFGHWIDRYIDLLSGETVKLNSVEEFVARFKPTDGDAMKFLVTPYLKGIR